jgi:predicted aspartyl protease
MRAWALGVAMVLLMTPRPTAGTATKFQLGDQGGVIVPVIVNAAGPFMMLLDTGATHSAITEDVAAAAGARAVAKSVVMSPVGETVRAIVSIDRLQLGPIVTGHALPSVVRRAAFGAGAVHGLIGQDVLGRLRYTLDFRRREVEWHTEAPPRRGVMLPLTFEHGRFLIQAPQASGMLRLVPDSGAGSLVLFDARRGPGIVETGVTVELRAAEATGEARQIRVRELRLGDRTLRDVPAVAIDRPDRRPAEGDGLLPLHLFERVTFDGPARLLILG